MTHQRLRKFNINDRYKGTRTEVDFDMCMVVRAGNRVFLRGQTGTSLDGVFAGEDAAAQAEIAMANVKALLGEAGAGLEHICKITIYTTDRAWREPVYQVIGRWLNSPLIKWLFPALTPR